MKYLAVLVVSVISIYTFLYGLEIKKQRNIPGFIAVAALAVSVIAFPVYLLFFR